MAERVFDARPILAARVVVGMADYMGTQAEAETVLLALRSFGFLLQAEIDSCACVRFSFGEFARLIRQAYDAADCRVSEVISTLDRLEERQRGLAGQKVPVVTTKEGAENGA